MMPKKRKGPAPGFVNHGLTGSPTYQSWQAMLKRTLYPSAKDYCRYGAKGIRVVDRWLTFVNFLADMGIRPSGTTLDRINGKEGYGPGNCRWSTPKEQSANRKNSVYLSTPIGVMPLTAYASVIGIERHAVRHMLDRGKLKGCTRIERQVA